MRVCTVCAHPKRAEIDAAIARGETERAIAGRFSVARASLQRHRPHTAARVARTERAAVRSLESVVEECERDIELVLSTHRATVKTPGSAEIIIKAVAARTKLAVLQYGAPKKSETPVGALEELKKLPLEERRERVLEMKHRVLEIEEELLPEGSEESH
jgi:esterase/lipase superfamily enzyme